MRISPEGRIGIGLGLVGILGGGALMLWPSQVGIGWAMIGFSVLGLIVLSLHHFLGWWADDKALAPHPVRQPSIPLTQPDPKPTISLAQGWAKLDPISLYDAASLWVGEDPAALAGHILTGPAAGTLKRLERAHIDRLITARKPYGLILPEDPTSDVYPPGADYVVSRAELVALAERWGEKPGFLFPAG